MYACTFFYITHINNILISIINYKHYFNSNCLVCTIDNCSSILEDINYFSEI